MLNKKNFYIDGKWVSPIEPRNYKVIDPSNEEICAIISLGSELDTNLAVQAAQKSFIPWWNTSKEKKLELLNNLLNLYIKRSSEMAEAISLEMGAPKDWSINEQSQSGEDHIKTFISKFKNFEFENFLDEDKGNYISYEPIGICALITPWNWPINQIALKVLPALAAGCTMILKPSEIAPLSGMLFAEMINEAGFPNGVFNLGLKEFFHQVTLILIWFPLLALHELEN